MTAVPTTPTRSTERSAEPQTTGWSLRRAVQTVAGVAMLAAPLLLVGGILTSPPQASDSTADYVASLARDPLLSSVSAALLHYGWVALALGMVVAMTLVRGRKGRVLTLIGGLLGGFTVVQISSLMLNDYFLIALGTQLSGGDAVRVADAMMVQGDLISQIWWQSGKLAILLPVFLYAGLARAGVISWFLVPLALFGMIAPYLVMGLLGTSGQLIGTSTLGLVAGGLVGLICYLPTFAVGRRLIDRGRLVEA